MSNPIHAAPLRCNPVVLGRTSGVQVRARVPATPLARSPRIPSPRAVPIAYAEGVRAQSPGQVTASFRAVTPPWGLHAERAAVERVGRCPRGRCRDRNRPRDALEFRATSVRPWMIQRPKSASHTADRQHLTSDGRFAGCRRQIHRQTVPISASARNNQSPRRSLGRCLASAHNPGRRVRSLHSRPLALGYGV